MKVTSFNKFFLLLCSLSSLLMARSTEDQQVLLKNTVAAYPEFKEILPTSSLNNAIISYVPVISNKKAHGIDVIPQSPLDKKDIARLRDVPINNSSILLEPKSLPIIFEMLTQAIANKDNMQIGFWTACLNNNIAFYSDLSALSEINYLSKYIPSLDPDLNNAKGEAISMRGSATTSFSEAMKDEKAFAFYEKSMKDFTPKIITNKPEYMTSFLLQRPTSILKNTQLHANKLALNLQRAALTDDKTSFNGKLAVIKSSSDSIMTTASILRTSVAFAKNKIKYKAPNSKEITDLIKKSVLPIPLEKNIFLQEIFQKQSADGVIGLLIEPLSTTQGSLLGKPSTILASQVGSALIKKKIEYRILNLDSILRTSFPSAKSMPVLIIPCTTYAARSGSHLQSALNKLVYDYQKSGGRIMWVSSHRVNFLGDISQNLQSAPKAINIDPEEEENDEIIVHKVLNSSQEDSFIDMIRSPAQFNEAIPLGYIVKEQENILPLISFDTNDEIFTIAAINKDKSALYFNPIILYPAAVDTEVTALIPAKFQSKLEEAFLSSVRLLLDPNTL
ncbi:hypothetical protein PQO03_09930 [Lentisphaera profundi]|uniref:Uncharacterized protein n=1 Tax=Lentisphaera profundi TaxID=1658616 RepID=A0ABY7VPX0_9BACT|nr:hypothetical protein [Lentisphaera profundi]WDE96032.1 hypothetical protein PQO03_09930 [Lentisphaera profundi]